VRLERTESAVNVETRLAVQKFTISGRVRY
jgi:hypothetical protein